MRETTASPSAQARTVRGAQQLFGNLTGWVREVLESAELRILGG